MTSTLPFPPAEGPTAPPRITYFVHDLTDAAVRKRVAMFDVADATTTVIGFHRDTQWPERLEGARVLPLGQTHDGRLLQRTAMVARQHLQPERLRLAARGADLIIGRNLEALSLAARARGAAPGARLVYECLDLHRLLLGTGPASRALHALEARLLREVDQIVVSSPAFAREYFDPRGYGERVHLIENKVLDRDPAHPLAIAPARPAGPPWTIGWFGMLRCRRSFDLLKRMAAAAEGRLRILIAGRPSPSVFGDLPGEAAAAPWVDYVGSYRAEDLPALYAQCHFAWSIDFFEEGLNSAWLLPNRLYEGIAFGALPIALASVETGRWLQARGIGITIDSGEELAAVVASIDPQRYSSLVDAMAALPRQTVTDDRDSIRSTVARIAGGD